MSKNLFFNGANPLVQKTYAIIAGLLVVWLLGACEKPKKPTTPTGNEPVPTDTNSLSFYLNGEWECLIFLNDRSFELDTVILTRTFYPSEKKFYQTVQLDSNVDPRNRLQFGGTTGWNDYDLRGDTMYLKKSDGNFHYDAHSYLIRRLAQDTMVIFYNGTLQAIKIRDYKFNRKK